MTQHHGLKGEVSGGRRHGLMNEPCESFGETVLQRRVRRAPAFNACTRFLDGDGEGGRWTLLLDLRRRFRDGFDAVAAGDDAQYAG